MKALNFPFTVIIISTLFMFISCSKDDEPYIHPNVVGNYNLISLESSQSMDLNYDGEFTTDFMSELNAFYFDNYSAPGYGLWFSKSTEGQTEYWFYHNLPLDGYSDRLIWEEQRYSQSNYGMSIKAYESVIEPEIIHGYPGHMVNADSTQIVMAGYPYVYKMIFVDDESIKLNVSQRFYDVNNETWTELLLEAFYEKGDEE